MPATASAASYAGVSFDVEMKEDWFPLWLPRETNFSRKHFPTTSYDDVQFGGLSNRCLKVSVVLYSVANLETLIGAIGTTKRTLTSLCGTTYTSVMLVGIADAKKHEIEGLVRAELEFERPNT